MIYIFILSKSTYSVQIQENTGQKTSENGYFSHSVVQEALPNDIQVTINKNNSTMMIFFMISIIDYYKKSPKKPSEVSNDVLNYHACLKNRKRGCHIQLKLRAQQINNEQTKNNYHYLDWSSMENFIFCKRVKNLKA